MRTKAKPAKPTFMTLSEIITNAAFFTAENRRKKQAIANSGTLGEKELERLDKEIHEMIETEKALLEKSKKLEKMIFVTGSYWNTKNRAI